MYTFALRRVSSTNKKGDREILLGVLIITLLWHLFFEVLGAYSTISPFPFISAFDKKRAWKVITSRATVSHH
jgi:hypothetical protein